MAENAFSKVKAALPTHADAILAEFNVRNNRDGTKLKGDWTDGYLCPLCGDKSGSASFTHQLFLRCHQCGTKADVFDWLAKHTGKRQWELCKLLAERLSVSLPKNKAATRSVRSMPRMTEEVLAQAIHDLWEHKEAEQARAVLAERQLDDQQLLAELGVGWIKGWIIFAQRNEAGVLMERYRGWAPFAGKMVKWMWFGQGTGGPGIWPGHAARPTDKILLLEGESDTLTALVRLRLHEAGWHVCTWTAGATSCPHPKDIPKSFQGKDVWIGYDNDVFQGPDYGSYWVETKVGKNPNQARQALEQRLRNLLQKVGPLFEAMRCKVTILQCPIDPRVKFGGDFRDWVSEGGRDLLRDWKAFPLADLPAYGTVVTELQFPDVFDSPHKLIRTKVQVEAIARDDVTLATVFEMKCEMAQHPACAFCPGARLFPDRLIDMTDFQRELAVGLEQQNVSDKIIKDVIQRPKGCPRVEVVPVDIKNGSEWKGMLPGRVEDGAQRSLHIFSTEPPSLSGEMEIEGVCYPNARGNGLVMLANGVRPLDKAEVDLGYVLHDFLQECPAFTNDVKKIDEYLMKRARDFAYHVTKIYGRPEIQIAHDLLMHSARKAELYGAKQRAWLDICVYGDTRTGKSLTFRRMFDFEGLGVSHTAVSNISRAGLLMGADKNGMLKPGLLPRCNGKAMMLDEFHFLVQNAMDNEHPMSWMQSARDEGVASGVKIYGNRDLPAQVRLVTVANWMRNKRRVFEFACEHLGSLYGAPETIARLDFGLAIAGPPSQFHLDKVEQFWTRDRTRALILRAWAQDAEQVFIDDEAAELSKAFCKEWQDVYETEQLPLFTPEEKCYSILRIAIAVANICFSHPRNDPYSVHVRPVHVEWAANWLLQTWRGSGYDAYSEKRKEKQNVIKVFEAERRLTLDLGLQDPMIAESRLNLLLTPFSPSEVPAITGLELHQAQGWLSRAIALHIIERMKQPNAYSVQYQLTAGGATLVQNLIRLARTDVAEWVQRHNELYRWSQITTATTDPDLTPMNQQEWDLASGGEDIPF